MSPRRRIPLPALRPAGLVPLVMALMCLTGARSLAGDDAYEARLAGDGLFLRQRAAARAALATRPGPDARFHACVDSLSVLVHRARPQVITDFLDDSTRIEIAPAPEFDFRDAFSYSLWLRLGAEKMVQQTKIVSQAGVSTGKVTVMGEGRRIVLMVRLDDESTVVYRTLEEIDVGRWVHLAVTYSRRDGGGIYFDGEAVDTRVVKGPPSSRPLLSLPDQPIYLGGLDRAFPGRLDDFRIFDRALDAEEIAAISRGEPIDAGLLGHWPLDDTGGSVARDAGPWAHHGSIGDRVLTALPGRWGTAMGFDRNQGPWMEETQILQERLQALAIPAEASPVPSSSVDALLGVLASQDAVLVHYVTGSGGAWSAWILDPRAEFPVRSIDLPVSDDTALVRLASELHDGVASPEGEAAYRNAAREVARQVFDPVEDAVADAREIWLRLTPALHEIPFAALVDGAGRYLVERYAFARCGPVASLAARQGAPKPPLATQSAVIFANPDFHALGDGKRGFLPMATAPTTRQRGGERVSCTIEGPALLGTAREVQAIVPLLEKAGLTRVEVYDWDTAQEDALDSLAATAGVLHVASHGYQVDPTCLPSTPEDPLYLSGIVLAGAMRLVPDGYRGADDGLLSAAEVAELDLSATQLLVLSGCATATGRALADEPLSGLAAAAWLAGARASVATLWPVSDETMPAQIEAFYREWTTGGSPATSLQQALLRGRALALADRGHGHPRTWAALVVEGL